MNQTEKHEKNIAKLEAEMETMQAREREVQQQCRKLEAKKSDLDDQHHETRVAAAIVASIGFQFRPEVSPQEHRTEVAAVTLASDLARQAGFGVAGDYGPIQWRGQAVLGLTDDIRNQVLDELRNNKDEARRFLTILDNRDS